MKAKTMAKNSCIADGVIRDKEKMEEKWSSLFERLALAWGEPHARDILEALSELYSIYTVDVAKWYANLFDPEIGGYYYSNSARDFEEATYNGETYKLLPDIESTYQGDGFLHSSLVEVSATKSVPSWYSEKIVKFVKSLQDKESGYFYHPQWGKKLTDQFLSRRGRDLQMAVKVLERYGSAPTYDTPLGTHGDGLLADGTPADMTDAYQYKPASAKEKEKADRAVAPHLVDKESFEKYLADIAVDYDKTKNSYTVGNHFEAQGPQILARDEALRSEGAKYSLCDILKEWFDERFNPETGIWSASETVGYTEVNGILKVAAAYNKIHRPLPDPVASMRAAIGVITSYDDPKHVCSVLNPWYAISIIRENVERYISTEKKGELAAEVDSVRRELIRQYPELVRATTKKLRMFRKPDGSFSYYENNTAFCSQGMPVAHGAPNEGDLNATNICNFGIIGHIFSGLGEEALPIFTETDRLEYVRILEKNLKSYERRKV